MNVFISLAPFLAKREGKMRCVCARTSDERNERDERQSEREREHKRWDLPLRLLQKRDRREGWQDEGAAQGNTRGREGGG